LLVERGFVRRDEVQLRRTGCLPALRKDGSPVDAERVELWIVLVLVTGEARVSEEVAVVDEYFVALDNVLEADAHVATPSRGDDHVSIAAEADKLATGRDAGLDGEVGADRLT